MKAIFFSFLVILLWGCSQEENTLRELDITAYPKSAELFTTPVSKPVFYPNPFSDFTTLLVGNSSDYTVKISSAEGLKTFEGNGQRAMLISFINEPNSAFNAEVLVDGKVYRFTLLNMNE